MEFKLVCFFVLSQSEGPGLANDASFFLQTFPYCVLVDFLQNLPDGPLEIRVKYTESHEETLSNVDADNITYDIGNFPCNFLLDTMEIEFMLCLKLQREYILNLTVL